MLSKHRAAADDRFARAYGIGLAGFLFAVVPAAATSPSGADCNQNRVDDAEEVRSGAAPDCNRNGRPDACDLVRKAGVLVPSSSVPTGAPRDGPLQLADFDGDGRLDAIAGDNESTEIRIHGGEAA